VSDDSLDIVLLCHPGARPDTAVMAAGKKAAAMCGGTRLEVLVHSCRCFE